MRWQVLGELSEKNHQARVEELIKLLLKNRDLTTAKQKKSFFEPKDPMETPLKEVGISAREMGKALVLLEKAKKEDRQIIVYGDYDSDGVCATAIVWETLYELGFKAMPYLPNRFEEGYGLNKESLRRLKEKQPDLGLVITVDQGIVAHQAVGLANKLGMEVIISDHHQPKKTFPSAQAVVHTTELSGSGVGWYLAREVSRHFGGSVRKIEKRLELAAIGTVTDLLALLGPSRAIVVYGLRQIGKTSRVGLSQLIKTAGITDPQLGTYELGFMIGPRLNSAGRVGDAMLALRLVCSNDKDRCRDFARQLEETNGSRQLLMEQLAAQAKETWLAEGKESKIIFVTGEGWPEGVIGLAASKLTEEFHLPAVVVSVEGELAKGSARSISGFNITAAIRQASELVIDAGGHPMAAGFSAETKNLKKLKQALVDIAEEKIDAAKLEKTLRVDAELSLGDLDLDLWRQLESFAPFGVGNPRPDFVVRGVKVVEARLVGKGREHVKLTVVGESQKKWEAIGFRLGSRYSEITDSGQIDLAFDLQVNEWNQTRKLQLRIKDWRSISGPKVD